MNLKEFPFYSKLDTSSRDFLKTHLKPVSVPKGGILFFQGDICDSILFLTSGEIRLYLQAENTQEITLYHLNAGEQCIVNTASTLSQSEAIASAVTLTDIEGYILDMYSVKELAHNSDVYQSFLFSIYTLRMTDLAKLINDIKFKNIDKRLIEWLDLKEEREIKMTYEDIANDLGSSVEVISKILQSLENDGIIQLNQDSIKMM
ncbi:Crp/Fnr family transcriptional regulator [Sulfurimonas sp.]